MQIRRGNLSISSPAFKPQKKGGLFGDKKRMDYYIPTQQNSIWFEELYTNG